MFHFESLDDGEVGNTKVKISITNLRKSTNVNDPYIQVQTQVTTDNSSYNAAARNGQGLTKYDSSTEIYGSMSNTIIIDVADTSNTKVKFYFRVSGSHAKLIGANTEGKNGVCFVRLGDT